MKKLLLAVVCCFGIVAFVNVETAEAAAQQNLTLNQTSAVEVEELGAWTHFRRKIFGGKSKSKDNEKERRHYYSPPPPPLPPPNHYRPYRNRYSPPPSRW